MISQFRFYGKVFLSLTCPLVSSVPLPLFQTNQKAFLQPLKSAYNCRIVVYKQVYIHL